MATKVAMRMHNYQALAVICLCAIFAIGFIYSLLLFEILSQGISQQSWYWITENPLDAGRAGGIASILLASFYLVSVSLALSLPLSLCLAILLFEHSKRKTRIVNTTQAALDLLASVPSIVFGLFGYAFFVLYCGLGFSILSGALTLTCMLLPLLTRLFEAQLRSLPDKLYETSLSSGLQLWRVYLCVLLPSIRKGIIASCILALARALSETAALIYTAGYVYRTPEGILDSGRSLSVHILDLAMNVPGGNPNSYATAVTLLLILLVINSASVWFGQRGEQREWIKT